MNNETEEYNNGGLLDKSITFDGNPVDMTTLLNLFTPPSGYGFGSFSIPKEKIVDLVAEQTVDTWQLSNDPAGIENYVREELAKKIAKQLIEEDLIQIQSDKSAPQWSTIFRAKVKVVQE